MAKKPPKDSHDKLRPDAAEIAFRVMREATGQAPKTPPPGERPKNVEAARIGAKGGAKGGPARAAKLSESERQEIARKGGAARAKRHE